MQSLGVHAIHLSAILAYMRLCFSMSMLALARAGSRGSEDKGAEGGQPRQGRWGQGMPGTKRACKQKQV